MTRWQRMAGGLRRSAVRVRLRLTWRPAAQSVGLVGRAGRDVQVRVLGVRSLRARPVAARLELRLPPGLSVADVEKAADRLAVALRVVHVEVLRTGTARTCLLLVHLVDVLAEPLTEDPPVLLSDVWSPSSPVPLGRCADGTLLAPRLLGQHLLIAGQTGTGKSTTVNGIVTFVLRCSPGTTRLVLLDPKDGMDLGWARNHPATSRFVGPDAGEAVEVLAWLVSELENRQRWAADAGVNSIEPDLRHPMLVVVIEELASYRRDRRHREDFDRHLAALAERGRALAIVLVAVLQTPSTDNLPSSVRNNLGVRLVHRTATSSHSEVALGDGTAKQPAWDASLLPYGPGHAGLGLAVTEQTGGQPTRFRAFRVETDALSRSIDSADSRHYPPFVSADSIPCGKSDDVLAPRRPKTRMAPSRHASTR